MRHFFVSCFSIMMLPVFVHAQPVENGKCCFTHEPFKTGSTPTNGCLEVTTCSEIQQRGLFVRCYHTRTNGSLRINGKLPAYKYSTQELEVEDSTEEFVGLDYPITRAIMSWKSNSEFIEGPKSRLNSHPIRSYCAGRMAGVRQRFHEKPSVAYRFKIGAYLREFTGRIIESYRQGQVVRERESRLLTLELASSGITIKR